MAKIRPIKTGASVLLLLFTVSLLSGILLTTAVIYDNRYYDSLCREIFDNQLSTEENVLNMMDWVESNIVDSVNKTDVPLYAIIEGLLPLHYSAGSIIKYGCYVEGLPYYGICGSRTRVMLVLLRRMGIRVRKLHLLSPPKHTMPLVLIEGKWKVFDPTFNFYWVNRQGQIAALDEIKNEPGIFKQILKKMARL